MTRPARFPELIIATDEFPADEQNEVFLAVSLAALMDKLAFSISSTVALIDFCDAEKSRLSMMQKTTDPNVLGALTEWRDVAARDTAINIYHFCKALQYLRSIKAPSLRDRLDKNSLKEAFNITRTQFQNFIDIRNAVGHVADFLQNVDSFRSHAVEGHTFILGSLSGRTFSITSEGRHYSFVIDASLRESTRRVAAIVMDAFFNAKILRHPTNQAD